jgi:hypothetical protein
MLKEILFTDGKYYASSEGDIYSKRKNGFYKIKPIPGAGRSGQYLRVDIRINGRIKTVRVHRLIAETFYPNHPKNYTVDHINGNKQDNRIENLEWVTMQENIDRYYAAKREKYGKESIKEN